MWYREACQGVWSHWSVVQSSLQGHGDLPWGADIRRPWGADIRRPWRETGRHQLTYPEWRWWDTLRGGGDGRHIPGTVRRMVKSEGGVIWWHSSTITGDRRWPYIIRAWEEHDVGHLRRRVMHITWAVKMQAAGTLQREHRQIRGVTDIHRSLSR